MLYPAKVLGTGTHSLPAPGRYISTWYLPTVVGEYHIFCDQYCGQGHSQMVGKVYVMPQDEYEWVRNEGKKRWSVGDYVSTDELRSEYARRKALGNL